jgi:phospholipase C
MAALSLAAACSASGGFSPGGATSRQSAARATLQRTVKRASASPIQHVVFIVQENRSFNNLFGLIVELSSRRVRRRYAIRHSDSRPNGDSERLVNSVGYRSEHLHFTRA